ncbi:MAG: hypothetical protein MPEBLZ_04106 [Candidatus Methanoperedens nitroreducens]|uniref:Uncharacterized protein n=1 Tax=Candidatus Methanoperedens nitratireducens TaxID=1392998 RepID=A0A0P7ZA80_9EURY|nr:MAG: hypothetical protein MPEBLZ_04106 [Candidatus Methanoperedens sp. BLZ1]
MVSGHSSRVRDCACAGTDKILKIYFLDTTSGSNVSSLKLNKAQLPVIELYTYLFKLAILEYMNNIDITYDADNIQ